MSDAVDGPAGDAFISTDELPSASSWRACPPTFSACAVVNEGSARREIPVGAARHEPTDLAAGRANVSIWGNRFAERDV